MLGTSTWMRGVLLTIVPTTPSCHCILGQRSAVSYHRFLSVSIVTELSRKQRLLFLHENRVLSFPHSPISSLWNRSHHPTVYRLLTRMVLVHSWTTFTLSDYSHTKTSFLVKILANSRGVFLWVWTRKKHMAHAALWRNGLIDPGIPPFPAHRPHSDIPA